MIKKWVYNLKNVINKISDKMIAIGISVGFVISLVPIIILAFYNYPCADDFSASDTAHWAWVETGSTMEVVKAAIENVIFNYNEWSGVYASVFWTSLQPGLFGEQFYGVTTVISVGLFIIAGIYLTYVIGSRYIKGNKYSWISVCVLYLFTSIQCMPDGNEGLYWHAGAANYTWAFAFLLLLTASVLSMHEEENKGKKCCKLVLACLLAVLVGGGNYITALQGCIWLTLLDAVMLAIDRCRNKKSYEVILKRHVSVIVPTIVLIVAFGVSVLAPGNKVRMGMSAGMNPIKAILESFRYASVMPLTEWFGWQTCILLVLAVPFMWNIVKTQSYQFPYPGIVVLAGYCFTAAGFTPSLYAQGMMEAGRLHDTVYFIFIFLLYVVMFYITGWIYQKKCKQYFSHTQELDVVTKGCVLVFILIWILGSVFHMGISTEIYVGTSALYALVSGQAERYRQENERRIELLESEEENVMLPKFTNAPMLLQFEDISPNPEEWLNTAMAVYYEKESVQREE